MRKVFQAVSFVFCGVAMAETNAPVATVSSRAPFVLQGVSVPVVGSTSWPAMEGDVIETKAAPAEIRLKDGTRIYMPAASRLVVSRSVQKVELLAGRTAAAASAGVKSAPAAISATVPMAAKNHNAFVGGVLNVLDGGAFVVKSSMLETIALSAAPKPKVIDGTNPALFSLVGLIGLYGVNSPIVGAIDQAISTAGAHIEYNAVNNTYYITGVQVIVGNAPPQSATFIISSTQILIVPGTIAPGAPPPPPLVPPIVPPTAGSGLPPGCKGTSLKPPDVSNSVITLTVGGTC